MNFVEDAAHEVSVVRVGGGGPLDRPAAEAALRIVTEAVELGADEELERRVVAELPEHPADAVGVALVSVEGDGAWSGHATAEGVFENGICGGCESVWRLAGLGAGEHGIGEVLVVIIGMVEALFEVAESGWG